MFKKQNRIGEPKSETESLLKYKIHETLHDSSENTGKSSEDVMNLKRGSLANMKQRHTRSRKYSDNDGKRQKT